jgi:hypothetical protein
MRVSNVLSFVAVSSVILAAASTSSMSAADATTPSPPAISCAGGKLTATTVNGWRINGAGPWKWDQATSAATFTNCDHDNHCDSASFVGRSCTGTVKAYVCTSTTCTSMSVAVTGS